MMINEADVRDQLRKAKTPLRKTLKKKGTLAIHGVEATPIVWKGELYRFEWLRNKVWGGAGGVTRDVGCYHFVNMETGKETPDFALDHAFGCCYEENGVMYVYGVRGEGGGQIMDMFWSDDLVHWESKEILRFSEDIELYNTSMCKGPNEYILAIEINGTSKYVGKAYTNLFAKSTNCMDWELLDPEEYIYDPARYTACPALRYVDGYYYIICLEKMPGHRWVPYISRSKDLKNFEFGLYNPVMWFDDNDKIVQHPENFTEEELAHIANAVDCNNSDVDLCEYKGKTIILYSWGNQLGTEFLAEAEYDGTVEEFLKSFFN